MLELTTAIRHNSKLLAEHINYFFNTVEPLLSGYPRGNSKWPLNGDWPLNRDSLKISITHFKKVTFLQYKIAWKGITESHEDDNKPVFE